MIFFHLYFGFYSFYVYNVSFLEKINIQYAYKYSYIHYNFFVSTIWFVIQI